MIQQQIKIVEDVLQASETIVQLIQNNALKKKEKNEKFFIAVSGGNSPKVLFEMLGSKYKESFPWDVVQFYWVDERCVHQSDKESNYGVFKSLLPTDIDLHAERMIGENNPTEEAERYAQLLSSQLPQKNGIPVFDFILLGMGDDGHTASIFPNQLNLLESEKFCEIAEHPISQQKRVTLTSKLINNAVEVVFFVSNDNKAQIVSDILHKEGNYLQYPAAHIFPNSGNLLWLLDKAAAYYYEKYYFC